MIIIKIFLYIIFLLFLYFIVMFLYYGGTIYDQIIHSEYHDINSVIESDFSSKIKGQVFTYAPNSDYIILSQDPPEYNAEDSTIFIETSLFGTYTLNIMNDINKLTTFFLPINDFEYTKKT